VKITSLFTQLSKHIQDRSEKQKSRRRWLRRLMVEKMEDRRVLATIDLAALTSGQGITIFGSEAGDESGISVSTAGDLNGDGFDDMLIGAFLANASGNAKTLAGESYVVFGGSSLPTTFDLNALGSAGITIFGADALDYSGFSVSSAGDVNGDGFDDLLIGANGGDASGNAKPNAGDSFLIFGRAQLPSSIDLANLGTVGVTIFGADAGDRSGNSVSDAGDINGDGFDDLIIGANVAGASGNSKSSAGESYLIFGSASFASFIDLASLGSAGITIFGAEVGNQSGSSVSGAGDVNGDGYDDLIIGAHWANGAGNSNSSAGRSYVVFGGASLPATIDLANLGAAGVLIFGADADDHSGRSVSDAGDVNGDGFDDLLIGAYFADASLNAKPNAGDSYVLFGGAALPPSIDLSNLGSAGITIFGADSDDRSGFSVSNAGDVNGDGFDDLLVGAFWGDALGNGKPGAGESYVIFGGESLPATIELAALESTISSGITIFGADALDSSGSSTSYAGDVNGDGFDDLMVGALDGDGSGNTKASSGESYLIFGGNFTVAITHQGAAANETLTGTALANVMNGGRGNDTLVGNGGADVLHGGQGNDILAVSDLSFRRIIGGTGSDTLRLDGSGLSLNLSSVHDNRILGIEQIDITGSGDNTLTLTQLEVLNLSDESNTLIVRRNAGDVVNIGTGWTKGTRETVGAESFDVYVQGRAILKIQVVPLIIDLSALAASQGSTIFGADASDYSGISVSSAGDVNGDGFDDVIVGANRADARIFSKFGVGASYVIFGGSSLPRSVDLANLGTAGITILGVDFDDYAGISVSSAGDVNGDGFADLLMGAERADAAGNAKANSGETYLIFGGASLPSTIDLGSLGQIGVTIFGAGADDHSGNSVSDAGDINGDGFDDLIIGALFADAAGNAKSSAGESYVVFGSGSLPATIDLANLGTNGITILGAEELDSSGVVSSAGDVNGDGFDDLIIGAKEADAFGNAKSSAGESYVIFGRASFPTTIDLANPAAADITIFGANGLDGSGGSVSNAGDVNGDGFDDLLIGARFADAQGNLKTDAGASYVIFGGLSLPRTIDLANLGSAGLTIFGADARDQSGFSVSSAGDMNGDGFDDLLIGAYRANGSGNAKYSAGESYVIFGSASLPGTIDLANIGSLGIPIFGADSFDQSGNSISGAGDVNGDGFADLVVGSSHASSAGNTRSFSGESYIIWGGDFAESITHQGTASDETLIGTTASNLMNGARGNDVLVGSGGADVLTGGQGNDILAVSDLSFKRVVGGTGNDTLRLDGGGILLNLASVRDNRILGIEQIDITGTGNNTLSLTQLEVLNISDESNTLIVHGNVGDILQLDPGWTRGIDETINSAIYQVLSKGAAKIKVASTIKRDTIIDLATLTASQGTAIYGLDAGDQSGFSVNNAGDVNGDGFDDLLIGARFAFAAGINGFTSGESYVIFGGVSQPATIDLAALGSAGVTIFGVEGGDRSGASVSNAGDVNGDGFDDLIIGAYFADSSGNAKSSAGDSYVVFGAPNLPTTINLANLGSAGVTLFGVDVNDLSGFSVSGAGDVNGDGFDDLLIGARSADALGNLKSAAGDSYVIFGGASLPSTIELATLGTAGITIFGADAGDVSGWSVSNGGDVNGDGFDDLLIGARAADALGNAKSAAGDTYIVYGGSQLPSTIDLATLGAAGVTIYGSEFQDYSGTSVSSAGDVNGDGFDDVLIGAFRADAFGNTKRDAGDSYVVFGGPSLPLNFDLANLGSAGITIYGADLDERSGSSVSNAGDVNGDGFDDLLIGAYRAKSSGNLRSRAGNSYLIFGGASPASTIDLAALGTSGISIFGAEISDYSGRSVSSAGDVNGDGFDDLFIGAYGADAAGNAKSQAGESYVIFGDDFTGAITHQGSAVGETLIGTGVANAMNGGRGNDLLLGNGGADVLIGGQGNDVLAVSDLTFKRIIGGTGIDTLRLDGGGLSLDLTTLRDNRLLGIEQIDITGAGNNTLTLNRREVLNLSDESNTLTVLRDAGDIVNIGGGWTQGTDETIGATTYRIYVQGIAKLKVQITNEAPVVTRSQGNVDGNVLSTLANTGTWSDPEGNTVTLTASLGTVVKNANGTWNWSYIPTAKLINQAVTITANDGANSSSVSFTINANVSISQRGLFYDGATGSSASTTLATDKAPLLPGQSSTYANYTNYSKGLNGLVVDVAGLPVATTDVEMLSSLQFAQWDGISAAGFAALSSEAVPAVSILKGSGGGGSARVRITFPDNTVENTWLRIVVLANAQTGLSTNDVFYFGNVIGDVDVGNTTTRIRVNALDTSAVRNNQSTGANSVSVTNIYDVNRDGRVNALDTSLVRNNQQTSGLVAPITAPSAFGRFGGSALVGEDESSLDANQMPSDVPKTMSIAMGSANELVATIGPRWTGESYDVPLAVVVRMGHILPVTSLEPTIPQKATQADITMKKNRPNGDPLFSQFDDYFACFGIEAG
jgi:FG-GAP repeat/RTX calcium-binding nonapeptide repeat (4 copies)/Dockerin type I domain